MNLFTRSLAVGVVTNGASSVVSLIFDTANLDIDANWKQHMPVSHMHKRVGMC